MIFTCTMNPSLDYYMDFEQEITCGALSRSTMEYCEPGGKGVNVSIVLNNLGIDSCALGFIGGFPKDHYLELLSRYEHIRPDFTVIRGDTRINVKCTGAARTELNGAGPYITEADMADLKTKVSQLGPEDIFVLAGSVQRYLADDAEDMLRSALGRGVKVILDTDPQMTGRLLGCHPFMIRMTAEEIGRMFGEEPSAKADVIRLARKAYDAGCGRVIVRYDRFSVLLVCAEGIFEAVMPDEDREITIVGAGDSMTAGFLADHLRAGDASENFRFGFACSCATAYSKGLATGAKIRSVLPQIRTAGIDGICEM
ncbi:MAG: 1-phosphofructokinase family hexose kinase [Solobacterium sp.]|nr:1-phosphofructokinase family hexose kinase [Solobacterium sp.]